MHGKILFLLGLKFFEFNFAATYLHVYPVFIFVLGRKCWYNFPECNIVSFPNSTFSINLKGRFKVSNSSYSGLLAHSSLQLLNVHVFRNSFTTILKEKQGCNGLHSTKNHIYLTWSWTCIPNFANLPWLLKIKSSLRFLRLNLVAKCTQWELFQETGTLWKMGYFYEI